MKKLMTLLFMAFVSFGTMNVHAEILYLDLSNNGVWVDNSNPAEYQAWVWEGSNAGIWTAAFTPVPGAPNIYQVTVPDGTTGCRVFRRGSGTLLSPPAEWNGSAWNQTGDITLTGENNCVKIYNDNWNYGEQIKKQLFLGDSFIFIVDDPETAVWYKGSYSGGTEIPMDKFENEIDLGTFTELKIGGEIQSWLRGSVADVTLNYIIDDNTPQTISMSNIIDSGSNDSNDKWQTVACIVEGLTVGEHTLAIWFHAANITVGDNKDLWDSNLDNNYIAKFTISNAVGLPTLGFDQQPVKTQYFTVAGQETANPTAGLYLVKKTFADNSVKTEKLFVK